MPLVADRRGDGTCVVLLHGQPGEARDWDLVVDEFAGQVRTVVPDRPGYGRTGGAAMGILGNVDAVVELLDGDGVERAVVVGHSWAGAVALELARRHPTRVLGLVLVASIGAEGSIDVFDRVLSLPVVGPTAALGGFGLLQVPLVRRLVAPQAADRMPGFSVRAWQSFVTEQRAMVLEVPALTERLGGIDVPAVVIVGERDRVVRPQVQEALARALPQAELVRVPDGDHLLPWGAPEVIAAAAVRVAERRGAGEPGAGG